jgi:hypothetical protein
MDSLRRGNGQDASSTVINKNKFLFTVEVTEDFFYLIPNALFSGIEVSLN